MLITGFLGLDKTTLLNWMLCNPLLADSAVIINEFGEMSIEHLLVEKTTEGSLNSLMVVCVVIYAVILLIH
ncbi:hypothetical protein O9A_00251 [Bartonella koehlerae C-29]|uniref:CobW/HypB/UreG nucleotide-binding domain-containing protein n=1 Tax=Bartonella koehlerae C-29 TaxID=1134510 RepID=A0A067WAW5_9HYPH|nr:hypothetical protein O9A_00251 [Bartonella koehlerae C-29]